MRRVLTTLLAAAAACGPSRGSQPAVSPRPVASPAVKADSATSRVPAPPPPSQTVADAADPLAAEASAVVDRQHAAYNEHDVEGFLAAYADSVAVHTLGDTVVLEGKQELRESTEAWFAQAPGARTEVVERMVLGPFVVDRQRVSGGTEEAPVDAIGIYEVREGLIRRVWSIPPPPTPR
jgi:hypothetical protein